MIGQDHRKCVEKLSALRKAIDNDRRHVESQQPLVCDETNVPQPDLMKMLGTKQVDATDLAYQFGVFAQNNKAGPVVAKGDDVDPDGQMACTPPSATS